MLTFSKLKSTLPKKNLKNPTLKSSAEVDITQTQISHSRLTGMVHHTGKMH
jgi:hypothetical protein